MTLRTLTVSRCRSPDKDACRPALLPSWSLSDPVRWRVVSSGSGWWEELGSLVVGVEADLPGGVVDDSVVVSAEEDEVG